MKLLYRILLITLVVATAVSGTVQVLAAVGLLIGTSGQLNSAVGFIFSGLTMAGGTLLLALMHCRKWIGFGLTLVGALTAVINGSALTTLKMGLDSEVYLRNHMTALVVPARAFVCFIADVLYRRRQEQTI